MDKDIVVIIERYNSIIENVEKRIANLKKDINKQQQKEIEKAKEKIYSYFGKIISSLPYDFSLGIKLSISLNNNKFSFDNIIIKEGNILLELSNSISYTNYYYITDDIPFDYNILEDEHVLLIIKNWDKITNEVENAIQKHFQTEIKQKINYFSKDVANLKTLKKFND